MATVWKLNEWKLTDTTVTVGARKFDTNVSVYQDVRRLNDGTEVRQRTGKALPSISITFSVFSKAEDHHTTVTRILSILEDDEVWTLDAPSGDSLYVYKEDKRAAFSTESIRIRTHKGRHVTDVEVRALLNGVWIADSGDYYETIHGNATRNTSTDYDTETDHLTVGQTGKTVPTIRLPEQTAGYPIGIRESDFAAVQLGAPTSTEVVGGQTFEFYDITNFVIPSLAADGDVGLWEIRSSPTVGFLDAAAN